MSNDMFEDYSDRCYECGAYGDDYSWDPELGEYVSNCDGCPFNERDAEYEG